MGSQFVEAVNQMSGCMGYTVLYRDVYAAVRQCRATYVIHNYVYINVIHTEKVQIQGLARDPPSLYLHFFASVVCLCTYSTFKTHSTIPTFVMFFAGKLLLALFLKFLWSVAS